MSNMVNVELVSLKQEDGVFIACVPGSGYPKMMVVDLDQYRKASSIKASLAAPDNSPCKPLDGVVLHQGIIYEKTR